MVRKTINRRFEDYTRELDAQAEQAAEIEEMNRRAAHFRAFDFGRTVQRMESSRHQAWQRVGWLLLGLVIGTVWGWSFPNHFYLAVVHRVFQEVRQPARSGNSTCFPIGGHGWKRG
jgi:hypothetical protein